MDPVSHFLGVIGVVNAASALVNDAAEIISGNILSNSVDSFIRDFPVDRMEILTNQINASLKPLQQNQVIRRVLVIATACCLFAFKVYQFSPFLMIVPVGVYLYQNRQWHLKSDEISQHIFGDEERGLAGRYIDHISADVKKIDVYLFFTNSGLSEKIVNISSLTRDDPDIERYVGAEPPIRYQKLERHVTVDKANQIKGFRDRLLRILDSAYIDMESTGPFIRFGQSVISQRRDARKGEINNLFRFIPVNND